MKDNKNETHIWITERWSDLQPQQQKYFLDKAILILTK